MARFRMTLDEQLHRRVAMARDLGRAPVRWIATPTFAADLPAGDELHGLPVKIGTPRSEWGIELVCEPHCQG